MSNGGTAILLGAVLAGGIVYLVTRDAEAEAQPCLTDAELAQLVATTLGNPDRTPDGIRGIAQWIRDSKWCDPAKAVAAASSLDQAADALEGTPAGSPRPPPISPLPGGIQLVIPPQQYPIPGGTFYQGYGYCPPGMVLDLSDGMCKPQTTTQGASTGACCDSCSTGGPCTGCDNG